MNAQERLREAAERGDIGAIRAAIADGADPGRHANHGPGAYPSEIALRHGHELAARYLHKRSIEAFIAQPLLALGAAFAPPHNPSRKGVGESPT